MTAVVLDGLLACALPLIAWRALATSDIQETIALFVAIGLLSALAWARLDAPDIGLVEAAVGAGITGALLITTLRVVGASAPRRRLRGRTRIALAVLVTIGALGIAGAVALVPPSRGLGDEVRSALPQAAAGHAVTAVLLDMRSYDTLLEIVVLLAALVAARAQHPRLPSRDLAAVQTQLEVLARLLAPAIVLVAGYLLWRGSTAPGGAFQAGTVLAGGGILTILAGIIRSPDPHTRAVRSAAVSGAGVFVVIASVPAVAGGHVLEYPAGWGGASILAIEIALSISIALVLVLFFPGAETR